MPIPGITNTVLDNGLGITSPATSIAHVIGPAFSGPLNSPQFISNQRQFLELFDRESQLADTVGYILANAGGPVVVTRAAASVVATESAIVKSGAGPIITHTAAVSLPKNDYSIQVIVTKAGAIGTSEIKYSADAGTTFSPSLVTSATMVLGTLGMSIDLAAGSYVLGETYTWTTTGPMFATGDLDTAFTAAQGSLLNWDFFVLAGTAATPAGAVTLYSNLSGKLNTEASSPDRYYRALMSTGTGTGAAALTAFNAVSGLRIGVLFGTALTIAPFPSVGRGASILPLVAHAAMRAAGNVISTDLAQVSGAESVGALPQVLSISQNEFTNELGLDNAKIGTSRTYSNMTGFFLTDVWLKSPAGSDFEFFQHGRIMDEACTVVAQQHTLLIGSNFETKTDGSGAYTEAEAQGIEKRVQAALDQVIGSAKRGIGPSRINGKRGHVSEIRYQVDRAQNVLVTKIHQSSIAIVPLIYPKTFLASFSFGLEA